MSIEPEGCQWPGSDPLYQHYHDTEWGVPVYDDARLFEFLLLETFQAGLSWITILRKRENFRRAFDGFSYEDISNYGKKEIERAMSDASIVRNRLKIESAVTNARAFIRIIERYGSFSQFMWAFTDGTPIINRFRSQSEVPATTSLSDTISKELRTLGFRFTGSTVIYAHMQATGMVNDHLISCFRHSEISSLNH
ncbi:MAG: DNA-3-methyladenine glycosylase I [Bacteroidales bacterium]|nr:DNA-3-methyladenine glycosylase I [Bacteroidales bacterium]